MTDNELLEQLFKPVAQMQIADNGFTERVVSKLPQHNTLRLSRLWTVFCVVVAVALFVLLRGWIPVGFGLIMALNNLEELRTHLLMFLLTSGIAYVLVFTDVVHRKRWSLL